MHFERALVPMVLLALLVLQVLLLAFLWLIASIIFDDEQIFQAESRERRVKIVGEKRENSAGQCLV